MFRKLVNQSKLASHALVAAAVLMAPCRAGQTEGDAAFQVKNYAEAYNEWKPLAEQGSAQAQTSLGILFANGWGVDQDYGVAMKLYQLAADQGFASAQYNLARLYELGRG